jgi:hypothetical protein
MRGAQGMARCAQEVAEERWVLRRGVTNPCLIVKKGSQRQARREQGGDDGVDLWVRPTARGAGKHPWPVEDGAGRRQACPSAGGAGSRRSVDFFLRTEAGVIFIF